MVQITHIKLVGGTEHHHIAEVKLINPATNLVGTSSRQTMVDWIKGGGVAVVSDGLRAINVQVIENNPSYIKTFADGVWTDNLLALPHFS